MGLQKLILFLLNIFIFSIRIRKNNAMQDLIGKKYQYKLVPDEIKIISNVSNDTVIFNDGGRVPLNRLDELFSAIDGGISPEQARKNLTTLAEDKLDPSNFFESTHTDLLEKLKREAEKIDTTKMQQPVVATNTTISDIVNEPPVKKIIVETDNVTGKTVSREENALPKSTDFLKKMKRNTEVEIIVKIVEHIPNLDFIKMMDENFDHGVLDYLIDDITEKIIASPSIVQAQVREQLNKLIKKKEPVKKKKDVKKKNGPRNSSTDFETITGA